MLTIHNATATQPTPELTPGQQLRAEAKRVAGQFEELFTRQMVAGFRKGSIDEDGGGLFGGGVGSSTYASWFDEHMARHMSKHGRIGIATDLMRYFERIEQIPTAETAAIQKGGDIDVDA